MIPNRIHVESNLDLNFAKAKAANEIVAELAKLDYKDAGFFVIREMPEVLARGFWNTQDAAYGVIFERHGTGIWTELYCRYAAGESNWSFSATNIDSPMVGIIDKPPGVTVKKSSRATPSQLHERFIRERPHGRFLPVSRDGFAQAIEDSWAHEMDWRTRRGEPTAQEVAKVAAASAERKERKRSKPTDPLKELISLLYAVRLEDSHRRRPPKSLTGAVMTGDIKLVKDFLAAGFEVNERTVGFSSPLNPAAKRGDLAMVELLLSHGCEPRHQAGQLYSPMSNAAESGNVAVIKRLIKAGVDLTKEGQRALANAAGRGHMDAVRLLMEAGVRPDSDTLAGAARAGKVEVLELFFSAGARPAEAGKALQHAAESGHYLAARFLIEAGVNPTEHPDYDTDIIGQKSRKQILPATLARANGFRFLARYLKGDKVDEHSLIAESPNRDQDPFAKLAESMRELEELEHGKRLEGVYREGAILRTLAIISSGRLGKRVNDRDKKHGHALTLAASNGDLEVVEALLAAGAHLEPAGGHAWSPLHAAANQGHALILKRLLVSGANANARTRMGETPLMRAVEWGNPDMVRSLLDAGADPAAKNSSGQKAMAIDAGLHDKPIKAMLKAAAVGPKGKSSKVGRGILCKRIKRMVDVSSARGAQDFTKFFGQPEWAIVAVRAPAESVAREYADIVKSARWEQDVANKRVLTAKRYVYILQFKNSAWSLLLRSLGWIGKEEIDAMPAEARELSSRLKTRAYTYMAEDTSACAGYELFENGNSAEEAYWEGDIRFKSTIRRSKPKFGASFPDPVFADEGIYLPACWFEDDGEDVKLGLEGVAEDGVERLDFIVIKQ